MKNTMPQQRLDQAAPVASEEGGEGRRAPREQHWHGDLVELSGLGIWVFNARGETTHVNRPMSEMLGYSVQEMMRLPVSTFGDEEAFDRAKIHYQRMKQGVGEVYELKLLHRNGSEVLACISATPIFDREKQFCGAVAMVMNITGRKRAEDRLRRSDNRYRLLFERNLAGIYRSSIDGRLLDGNQALAGMFGYDSFNEMRGMSAWTLYAHAEDREKMLQTLSAQGGLNNYEILMRRRDGTHFWTLWSITLAAGKTPETGVLEGAVLDITDLKRSEEGLKQSREQLRALSARIESVVEEERRNIAREIHDQLGQLMTGLKLEIAWVEKRIAQTEDESLRRKLIPKMAEIETLLDTTIQTVRDIASKLRPGHLDDLGLIAAIEWEGKGFGKRAGVKVEFTLCREPKDLAPERATGLFRIYQEILTNVARHAQAKKVQVDLTDGDGQLLLVVRDDGIGIPAEKMDNTKSLGLLGMRERALLLDGDVAIERAATGGTSGTLRVPIN